MFWILSWQTLCPTVTREACSAPEDINRDFATLWHLGTRIRSDMGAATLLLTTDADMLNG